MADIHSSPEDGITFDKWSPLPPRPDYETSAGELVVVDHLNRTRYVVILVATPRGLTLKVARREGLTTVDESSIK
jgi:hypothetical protein